MEIAEKNSIYDRLLAISMRVDSSNIPDPRYINEKIGQCHVFIEEVERFYIKISKEISVIQTALNNSTSAYEHARDDKIANDIDIKNLPGIKDKEAKANNLLRKELDEIKSYQNELSDLENIHKAINLKLKNLSRLNADIKAQQRLMESQMRLGTPNMNSAAAKSLAEELSKSTIGQDVFEGMETAVTEERVVDPTVPLDVDNLLRSDEEKILSALESTEEQEAEEEDESWDSEKKDSSEDDIQQFLPETSPTGESSEPATEIDLDKALEPGVPSQPEAVLPETIVPPVQPIGGVPTKTESEPEPKKALVEPVTKNPNDIDIDALLSQFK